MAVDATGGAGESEHAGDVAPQGDAFQRAYEALAPALHAWAALRIRSELRPWIEPSDVVQEVWCRAWRARLAGLAPSLGQVRDPLEAGASGAVGPVAALRPWLFRVAKNVLLEALRRSRAAGPRGSPAGPTTRMTLLGQVPDSVTAASVRLSRDEGLARFTEWVRALDEEDRELLMRCGLEGWSHAEVARDLGVTRDAAAKRWQRLCERLSSERLPRELLADAR